MYRFLLFALLWATAWMLKGQSTTYDVLWSPARHASAYGYNGVGALSLRPSFEAEYSPALFAKAHVRGDITLCENADGEKPLPRDPEAFMARWKKICPYYDSDLGEEDSLFAEDPFLALDGYPVELVFWETWTVGAATLDRQDRQAIIELRDPSELLGPFWLYLKEPITQTPTDLWDFARWDMPYIQEESLEQALDRQRIYLQVLGYQIQGTDEAMRVTRNRDCEQCAQREHDSLLQAWHYLETLPDVSQVDDWYPVQTKPHIQIRLEDPFPQDLPFKQGRQRQTQLFLKEIIPSLLQAIIEGNIPVYDHGYGESPWGAIAATTVLDRIREVEEESNQASDWETDNEEEGATLDAAAADFQMDEPDTEKTEASYEPDLFPYQEAVHVRGSFQRVGKKKVSFSPEYLMLIWKDPADLLPERTLCAVKVADVDTYARKLPKEDRWQLKGKSVGNWLMRYRKLNYYPIEIQAGLRTFQEAWLLKNILEKGLWHLFPTQQEIYEEENWEAYKQRMPQKFLLPDSADD